MDVKLWTKAIQLEVRNLTHESVEMDAFVDKRLAELTPEERNFGLMLGLFIHSAAGTLACNLLKHLRKDVILAQGYFEYIFNERGAAVFLRGSQFREAKDMLELAQFAKLVMLIQGWTAEQFMQALSDGFDEVARERLALVAK